jgi:two-component system sensor histidine kinase DesK
MPHFYLVFLAYLFIAPARAGATVMEWAVTLASIAVFLPLYVAQFSGALRPRRAVLLNVAMAVLGFAVLPLNPGANTYVIFAAAGAPFALPPRAAALFLSALIVATGVEMFVLPLDYRYWVGIPTMLLVGTVGGSQIYQAELMRQQATLRRAREDVEEMAKLAERERIARDLHDLLGHTLSVITLKSELASKLADTDPARAVEEIRDVERVSREALSEVRRAVEGYQQHGLQGQLQGAARALTAAGVHLETQIAPVALPARHETVLALALREAVTNVLRHSASTRCLVRLDADARTIALTVEDDGRGGPALEGSGLAGMLSRVAELGGRVEIDARDGTRVMVTLPAVPLVSPAAS